tara:strand:+ start:363 stop:1223 length:861 start_codon:yes stop_codon:yes gene_type:complete
MPSLSDIKRRIRSVKNTQQITKAMKLVSASKLRKAQEAILKARPYAVKTRQMLNSLAGRCDVDQHPFLKIRAEKKILIFLITSDKGLCGGFNSSLIKQAMETIREKEGKTIELIIAGKKGNDVFQSRPYGLLQKYIGWTRDFSFKKASEIADNLGTLFSEGAVDKIYIIYNEFKSVLQQNVVAEQLLPIAPDAAVEGEWHVDYIYEPDSNTILERLLKMYLEVEVYRAFLESSASEHGARMTAMDNATRNAKEMIGQLTLFYNKARQAYITKELIEIVSGAEALKG